MRNSAVGVLVTAIQVIAGSACRNFHRQALFSFGLAPSFQKGPGGGAPRSGNGAIINCHVHTFTLDHVPDRFLPLGLTRALRTGRRNLARWLSAGLGWVNPFSDSDRFSRFAKFLRTSAGRTQTTVFEEVQTYYPEGTQFIVLPMDMAFMKAGKPKVEIDEQHEELAKIATTHHPAVLPFIAIDPRRFDGGDDMLSKARPWLERQHAGQNVFRGIKLYPPQGYSCADPIFNNLFDYCQQHSVPIMTHCS